MAEVSDTDSDLETRPTREEEEEWPDIDVDSDTSEAPRPYAAPKPLSTLLSSARSNGNESSNQATAPSQRPSTSRQKTTNSLRRNANSSSLAATSTTSELFAKAKDAMDRGQFQAMINDEEAALLSRCFHPMNDSTFGRGRMLPALGSPGWYFLPKEHKEAYRARAEASRRAAWAEFETALATPLSTRLENYLWTQTGTRRALLPPHKLKTIVRGFELFRDELEAGLAYQETVRRWGPLTEEQRKAFDGRAWSRHRETCIALPRDYLANICRERGKPVPWKF
ncbi:hypothetical protein VTI74DRAFT_4465 [Chaetomium olivicolor]